jgi:mono/diheme cytochrome c family protein
MSSCKASEPGQLESSILKEVKKSVTIGGKDVKNPIAYSPEVAKSGQDHFGHHCQTCHGYDGQNTGVPFATKMDPPVPELTSADVQEYADGQLKWIIENGIAPSGMPAWKGILDEDEMWQIVHYIRHLPPKGSLGVPEVYKEEAEEHEQTKSPGTKTHTHKDGKEHKH